MKDCHVHSNISHDGVSDYFDYINYALSCNVDEITFTEHWDDYSGVDTKLHTLDVFEYYNAYLKCKDNDLVRTNFGLEIGLQPDLKDKISSLVASLPFDFIIGSSHITCKKDMSVDPSFFENLTRREAYLRYFEEVLRNIETFTEFDVYGHLDYVVRYGGYQEKYIDYKEFQDILDAILSLLIKKGKGIEVNSSGFRYNLGLPHPNIEILKRYKELGGKIITIGSDAHKALDLASHLDLCLDILETLGYKEISVFHERKLELVPIKELR